jgi:alpha-galactosidase
MELSTSGTADQRLVEYGLTLRATGPVSVKLQKLMLDIEIRCPDSVTSRWQWYRNGWQSWSHAGMIRSAAPAFSAPVHEFMYRMKENPAIPRQNAAWISDMVTVLVHGQEALLVGACNQQFFQEIEVRPEVDSIRLTLSTLLDGIPLSPGCTRNVGGWQIQSSRDPEALLEEWGRRVGRIQARQKQVLGWCSWYERKTRIDMPFLQQVMKTIRSRSALKSIRLFQVDDGYQHQVGDWLTPHPRFRGSLQPLGQSIVSAGFEAGLWVSPFIAQSQSRLLKDHPDWFLRCNGALVKAGWNPHWKGAYYPLDVTHPQVLPWLTDLFSTLRSFGFTFFKLDYLYPACMTGDRHDPSVGRFEAFQNAIRVIRDACGPGSFLLGCGAPLAPSNGLFDAMRISCDTEYQWKNPWWLRLITGETETIGIYPSARNTLTRNLWARSMWGQDPDCLLIRKRNDSLALSAIDLYSQLCLLLGEMVLVGDDVTRWSDADFQRFESLIPLLAGEFRALDCLRQSPPRWFRCQQDDQTLVGLVNLEDGPVDASIDLSLCLPRQHGGISVDCLLPLGAGNWRAQDCRLSVDRVPARSLQLFRVQEGDIQ